MLFIGITGGVGAGKSTVLRLLKENFNCKVLLADEVAAELMKAGNACFDAVVSLDWPENIVGADGEIDRALMARLMFSDDKLLTKVNAIVHPAVEQEVLNQVEDERAKHKIEYFFFEAALLIECGYGKLVDEMWYIYADENTRAKRLKESRGYSDERIKNTIAKQRSDASFREHADRVIDNSGDKEQTLLQLRQILE